MTPCMRKALRNQLDNPALPIIIYMAVVGILAVASGGAAPVAVERNTPEWLTTLWAVGLAVGGVLAVGGCLTGRTRGESAGLALLVFATGLYGLAEAVAHWPVGLETTTAVLSLMACCLIRMRVLHKARKAQRVAQRIVDRLEVPPWTH